MSAPKRIKTTADSQRDTSTSRQSAKDECESFLARQEPWVRAFLRGEDGSPDIIGDELTESAGTDALNKATDEYEELLKRCPKHRREYRKRTVDDATRLAQDILLLVFGPDKPGRTPSRELGDLGRKAAKLYSQGLSWGEVARSLCPRKSLPEHKCDKNCADRIRQIAQPYRK